MERALAAGFALLLGLPRVARAETALTLADAVARALAVEPLVAEARVGEERSKLAVLRAQLDRVSIKVDGQVQELWNKTNIGGPAITNCGIGPVQFITDPASCAQMGGTAMPTDQSPSGAQGLSNFAAQVAVPIFSGLRVEANVARAKRLHESDERGIRQQRRDTALATARAYWAVRRLGLLEEAQAAAVERLREAEQVAAARVDAGLAPPIDRNRATLRRLQQEAQLADLAGQRREASVQLATALGLADELRLIDAPEVPERAPPPVEELVGEARRDRAEPQRAWLQVEAQEQAVRMARSGWFPQLGAFGLLQFGNNPYITGTGARAPSSVANPFAGMSGNLTFGLSLTMNFFDTLNTWTQVKDARLGLALAGEERRRAERLVEGDVRAAHAKVEHLRARRAPLVAARDVARDNLAILEARYRNGDALVIEFLDAQVELASAELQLADVTAQLRLGWLELDASLGTVVGEGHE